MKKCLVVTAAFYPAYKYGGPVRSLKNLVDSLGGELDFKVVTSDRDMGDTNSFDGINVNSWNNKYNNIPVFYCAPEYSFLKLFKEVFKKSDFDILYINSFFDTKFSILIHLLVWLNLIKCENIILAPRGELTEGAMSFKRLKKLCYVFLFRLMRLEKKIKFHFTSTEEFVESKRFINIEKYKIAPNMHAAIPNYTRKSKVKGELELIFLSRISPKKNLEFLISALKEVNEGKITFTIAGTIDDADYWKECQAKLSTLPANINVRFLGPINRIQVRHELGNSHLFVLPTYNENYGHSIVEAMVSSNLLLISDQTPWSKVQNCGSFVGKLDNVEYFSNAIRTVLRMNEAEFNEKTFTTFEYCKNCLDDNEVKVNQIFK
ncbi:glycosyltransferase [Catenovulum maritimum]|uniref:Glycosyl transferase family 1 domain-containing protein n=1 Tax=Catenovulum maritimum TaxID=1513271 RepID=A0A0J8GPL3_9ALTE|nr:glycosyltransferase [Catenovulum maritimum]KMT64745.1 hypothetical protein XM47_12865 [Catenovulum maritimum]